MNAENFSLTKYFTNGFLEAVEGWKKQADTKKKIAGKNLNMEEVKEERVPEEVFANFFHYLQRLNDDSKFHGNRSWLWARVAHEKKKLRVTVKMQE